MRLITGKTELVTGEDGFLNTGIATSELARALAQATGIFSPGKRNFDCNYVIQSYILLWYGEMPLGGYSLSYCYCLPF